MTSIFISLCRQEILLQAGLQVLWNHAMIFWQTESTVHMNFNSLYTLKFWFSVLKVSLIVSNKKMNMRFSWTALYAQFELTIYSKFWTSPVYYLLRCLKTTEWMANSVDPDHTPYSAASDLGLHCMYAKMRSGVFGPELSSFPFRIILLILMNIQTISDVLDHCAHAHII